MVNQACIEPRRSHSAAWNQLLQMLLLLVFAVVFLALPHSPFWITSFDFRIFIFTIGMIFCFIVTQLIVCHVTDMHFPKFQPILIPLPFLLLNSLLKLWIPHLVLCETLLMKSYLAVVTVAYFHFVITVIREICDALGISCLTIPLVSSEKE